MDDAERIRKLTAERDTLRERVRQLENAMRNHTPLFKLPLEPQQREIVNVLLARECMPRELLATVLDSSPESIKVQMSRIRQRLAPLGVKIGTDWGGGYYITPEMKEKVRVAAA